MASQVKLFMNKDIETAKDGILFLDNAKSEILISPEYYYSFNSFPRI